MPDKLDAMHPLDSTHPLDGQQHVLGQVANETGASLVEREHIGVANVDDEPKLLMTTIRTAAFLAVTAMFILGNLILPYVFWDMRAEAPAFFFIGALAAQPALVAFWCAIGSQQFHVRILTTFALNVVFCGSYIVGLQIPDYPNSSMPLWVAIFIFAIGISGFIMATILLKGIGWGTGERIIDRTVDRELQLHDQNYSIGHIIALTTLVAVAIVGVRSILPTQSAPSGSVPPPVALFKVIGIISLNTACSILMLACAAIIALREPLRKATVGKLLFFVAFSVGVELIVLTQIRFFNVNKDGVVWTLTYSAGFFLTTLAVLLVLRRVGYRLVRVR